MTNTNITRNTFSILFYIVRSKENKNGECPIYCKVTVQGRSSEFSTHVWTIDKKWDTASKKIKGYSEDAKTANASLIAIQNKLQNIRTSLLEQDSLITSEIVVNLYSGRGPTSFTLIHAHEFYNEQHIKKLLGNGYAQGTYDRFCTSLEHIKNFLKFQYQIDDIKFSAMDYSFAMDYDRYLKIEKNCCNNTTVKYVKNLKTVIRFAVDQEWLQKNPIQRYKGKLDKVEKEFLTFEELKKIQNKNFESERVSEVRDVFVFCCFTGLPYSDVAKLSKKDIIKNIQGNWQISIKRTKTNIVANIPLLDEAKFYLDKYKDHLLCLNRDTLFPVKSNQKQNEYLKEIAGLCGLNKTLTTHIARHTFATLMLSKGASIESVSSMLGHTNIKTTQIYAKITAEKDQATIKNLERFMTL
jgi:site-specific recombinase XerD